MTTQTEFFTEMLELLRQKSGLSISEGSEPALRLLTLAVQLEALSYEAQWVYRQAFPQTATGGDLDRHAELRGIARRPAVCAAGSVRFYTDGTADVTVPSGTVCLTPSLARYVTTQTVTIAKGVTSGDAAVTAETPGEEGNLPPSGITAMAIAPMGVSGCTNPASISGGAAAEDDESLRARVVASYRSLPNGANAAYYQTEAMSVDGVAAAKAVARPRGAGTVDVYITSAAGVPSGELIERVRNHLAERREIAVDLKVNPPQTVAINVAVTLTADDADYDGTADRVRAAVAGFFHGGLLAKPFYVAELTGVLMSLDGVKNVKITSPTVDTPADDRRLPVAGTITVSRAV